MEPAGSAIRWNVEVIFQRQSACDPDASPSLVVIVGILIRARTPDSFVFERQRSHSAVLDLPAVQVWRDMPLVILRTRW